MSDPSVGETPNEATAIEDAAIEETGIEETTIDAAPETTQESISLTYTGSRGAIFEIALLNLLLSLLSLGIYNFWGRTRIRRYLWSHTQINGTPLEYHGTGGQIFIGFIIISVIFFGFNYGFEYVQQLLIGAAFEHGENHLTFVIMLATTIVSMTVYLAFLAYLTWAVRRYWLAMTSWRGIRLKQTGLRQHVIAMAIPRALLTVFTLGLAYPWLIGRTDSYAFGQSHIGNQRLQIDLRPRRLLGGWLPFLFALQVVVFAPVAIAFYLVGSGQMSMGDRQRFDFSKILSESFSGSGGAWFGVAILIGLPIIVALLWALWRARLFNCIVSALTLGDLKFQGNIRARSFFWPYFWTALCSLICLFILLSIFGAVVRGGTFSSAGTGLVAVFSLFFVNFLIWGFFRNIFVVHRLWQARVCATTVLGTIDLGDIKQGDLEKMRQGEGLGMVFEGGFGEA